MKKQAMFYEKLKDKIHCYLCPHNCVIANGHIGKCNVRSHEAGELYTLNYGEVTSIALDPIEKNLYTILSLVQIFYQLEVLDAILSVAFVKTIISPNTKQRASSFPKRN